MTVVLFFQSTVSKSWREKLAGVYRYAGRVGWQVQVVDANASPRQIRESLSRWQPIGCLVDRAMTQAKTPAALFRGVPTVFLDQNPKTCGRRPRSFAFVTNDSAAVGRLAAEELLKTDIRDFTYVPWSGPAFWSDERGTAFARAIRAAGRSFAARPTLAASLASLRTLPRPCGVFCANDMIAQKVMAEANRLGLRIPHDLAVIGVDDDELICENTRPALTSVLPDFAAAGWTIAACLERLIRGERVAKCTYGPVAVVKRASTRWTPRDDPKVSRALQFIRAHYLEQSLRSESVVGVMGCSRRLADLRFREVTGHSIRDEIHELRLERAYALLRNPNQAITPIPALCGYASEPFFKRMFKQTTGLTMRDWRKTHLGSR